MDLRQLVENLVEQELEEANALAAGGVSATGGSVLGQDMGPTHDTMWSGNIEENLDERRSKAKMAQPVIMYHGTTSAFLPSIVSHGLSPKKSDKKNIWQGSDDNDLDSLEGVYLGSNWVTAMNYGIDAARVFGGKPVILTIQAIPQSALADEDSFEFRSLLHNILRNLMPTTAPGLLEIKLLAAKIFEPEFYQKIKEAFVNYIHEKFTTHNKNIPKNEQLLSNIFELVSKKVAQRFYERNIAEAIQTFYSDKLDAKPGQEYNMALYYANQIMKDIHTYDESLMKQSQTAITKLYASNFKLQKHQDSFRVNQNIGFSGRNRIVGIIQKEGKSWVLLYGNPHEAENAEGYIPGEATWEQRRRALWQQRQSSQSQMTPESVERLTSEIFENVLDKMGLKKATTQVRRDVVGGSPVYMDKHDGDKEGTKKVMAKVAKNLNKKPYSKDPPRMGLTDKKG